MFPFTFLFINNNQKTRLTKSFGILCRDNADNGVVDACFGSTVTRKGNRFVFRKAHTSGLLQTRLLQRS